MKKLSVLISLLLTVTLTYAIDREYLWKRNQMPDFQPHQTAAMLDEAQTKNFKPDKNRVAYIEWYEQPSPDKRNGACAILISGGGYFNCCDMNHVEHWYKELTAEGVQCVKLVYRTPRPEGLPIYQSAWEDGQRAVRMVRSEAAKRGFDPEKIGVVGMSAGSHLGLLLSASSQTPAYAKVDALDDLPCHINWAILNSPAYITTDASEGTPATRQGYGADVKLCDIFKFDDNTCPISLHHGGDDIYSPNGSTLVYRELKKRGIATELHLYSDEGHRPLGFQRGIEFLRQTGFLGQLEPEVVLDKRFTSDDARIKYVKEEVWPDGKMPDFQEHQCTPYIEWHFPKVLKTSAIQIIYSGGGYNGNGPGSFEVTPARRYLNEKGMTVVTMMYRTPRPKNGLAKHTTAWEDLQRAIRLVRSEAPSYGLDPNRIGIMGSSAGGHLTVMGVTSSMHQSYYPIDELDKIPCNVQWGVGIYPAYTLTDGLNGHNTNKGLAEGDVLAPEFSFDLCTAPMLIIHGDADPYTSMGSVKIWEKMRSMGIQSELHTLAERTHCFQSSASPGTGSYTWLDRIWEFLSKKVIASEFSIYDMTTQYQQNPLGIDDTAPQFSWKMRSPLENESQRACRILVSTDTAFSGKSIVFDSGKIETSESVGFKYNGKPLTPRTRYWWKVQVWDNNGKMNESQPSWFETGLMNEGWSTAQWIGSSQAHFSKYRSIFDISYDIELKPGCDHGTFIYGYHDGRYVIADLNRSGMFTLSHVDGSKTTLDGSFEFKTHDGPYHIELDVRATDYSKAYTTAVSIDGVGCGERITSRFDPDEAWQPYCRLYSIGYLQPEGQDAFLSNIVIRDNVWKRDLYVRSDKIEAKGDGKPVLWSPADESGAAMLRRTVKLDKEIKSARLYTTARGIYEYYINGQRLGDDRFNPGSTDYRYRILYNSYDITPLLSEGNNAICAQIGSGWFSDFTGFATSWQDQFGDDLSLLAKIVIEYADGTSQTIVSDSQWRVYDKGPVVSDSFLNGEDYDARREVKGWSKPGFDDSKWSGVTIYPAPEAKITAYIGSPIRTQMILKPVSVSEPQPGIFVYDMGQNMVGIPRIRLKGAEGQEITFRYGEMIYPVEPPAEPIPPLTIADYEANKGMVYNQNYRGALSTDHYILKGDPEGEVFEPHFTFHGFRYIAIQGLAEALPLDNIEGLVMASVGECLSDYHTGNDNINQLYSNIVWGQRGNFLSIPTDCPQRDERMGWMGDAQIFARSATYNMMVEPFFTRWFQSIRDIQGDDGSYPDYVPKIGTPPAGSPKGHGALGWMDAGIIIPWQMYLQYGDRRFLEEHWDSMVKYIDHLTNRSDNYIQPSGGYGDWLAIEGTDTRLTNTAYYAYDVRLMAAMARILGRDDQALSYDKLFEQIRTSFFAQGFDFKTQTSIVVPMQAGLFEGALKQQMIDTLVNNIAVHDNTLTTGFIGTPYLNLVLSENGRSDIAFKLFEQTKYPSWLYPVLQGATTIWERWNSYTIANGFGIVDMNSFNHYSYGAIQEWMMAYTLGIQVDPLSPAYKHIILQPQYCPSLGTVSGHYDSMYGRIAVKLTPQESGWSYEVDIPANTTATLHLPDGIRELGSGHHLYTITE